MADIIPLSVVCVGYSMARKCFVAVDHVRNIVTAGSTRGKAIQELCYARQDYDAENDIRPQPDRDAK